MQKKARITYSVCSLVRRKIILRRSIGFVLLLSSIGLFFFGATADIDEMLGIVIASGFAAMIASLILFVIASPVKVVRFKNGWFRIKGCSPDFLDSLPEYLSPF